MCEKLIKSFDQFGNSFVMTVDQNLYQSSFLPFSFCTKKKVEKGLEFWEGNEVISRLLAK